jgi:GntR family transcriptional regulator/MocR family aminotransferase
MTIPGLSVDLSSDVPVYRQIADGVRAAALDGRLDSGRRLPPTRDLARQLGVNRNTVVAAYDLLAADGVVRSHTGRGTYLVVGSASASAPPSPLGSAAWFTGFSRAVEGPGVGGLLSAYSAAIWSDGISFAGSYPARDLMPVDKFRRALTDVLARDGADLLSYGPTAGHGALRESVAREMRRNGSKVSADGIVVTNGSQQGLDLVFRALLDRGDPVVLEEPTYTGALSVLHSLGARLVGVPVDEDGIRPDLLAVALERHRPRVVYLQPTFHNPTTAVMGEGRRREVLSLASRHRCVVVEDDWAGDLRLEGTNLPTLHALDTDGRVVYVSTFSKKLIPGLRIGWVAAPAPVLDRLVTLKQIEDCGTSPVLQAALHAFLEGGGLEAHLARVRPAYRERRDAMVAALERHFPEGASWTVPAGGLFLWVTLAAGFDSGELLALARERGVLFNRGDLFHVEGGGRNFLRLSYAAVPRDRIEAGIEALGKLVKERWPGARNAPVERAAEAVPIL